METFLSSSPVNFQSLKRGVPKVETNNISRRKAWEKNAFKSATPPLYHHTLHQTYELTFDDWTAL